MPESRPALLVWSSLFPNPAQPQAGVFIRERMLRVGEHLPITVISPQPWFPLQSLIRKFRPHFRPPMPRREQQSGIEVHRPRYLSIPGVLKSLDGYSMALGAFATARRLQRAGRVDLIDAHFAYPDGLAASRVARWLAVPCTITLRGTEVRHSQDRALRPLMLKALNAAARIFTVSDSLRRLAIQLGVPDERIRTVGNGVDSARFRPVARSSARRTVQIAEDAPVLITVGGLVERKGFHRVIACLPALLQEFPTLHYLVVGSAGPEGDYSAALVAQVQRLGLMERVRFLGALPAEGVCTALSAADVFVLSTRNEGWANVLLEAMACGLPVVATDVGGNAEVICRAELGTIVPFDDHESLLAALRSALRLDWDRAVIRRYAQENDWQQRVRALLDEFRTLYGSTTAGAADAR
jgi:glycosyltransferase involved in cell wall biosynthesis